jgi:hypothetical protein
MKPVRFYVAHAVLASFTVEEIVSDLTGPLTSLRVRS